MATIAEFVRDYLKAHPGAKAAEITRVLKQKGIITSSTYVTKIISSAKKMVTTEPAAAAVEMLVATINTKLREATAPLEKAADTLTLDQLKNVARAINRIRQSKAVTKTAAPPAKEKPADTPTLKVKKVARAINRVQQRKGLAEAAAPPTKEKPADRLKLDQIKKAAQAIKVMRTRLH